MKPSLTLDDLQVYRDAMGHHVAAGYVPPNAGEDLMQVFDELLRRHRELEAVHEIVRVGTAVIPDAAYPLGSALDRVGELLDPTPAKGEP